MEDHGPKVASSADMRPRVGLPTIAILVAACPDRSIEKVEPNEGVTFTQSFGREAPRDVDLVFVIDSSGSMYEEQEGLSRAFPGFVRSLKRIGATRWRIGVTTTDLGGFGYSLPGCRGEGDGGRLLQGTRNATCSGYEGEWLWFDNGVTNALGGDPAAAFGCVARVGIDGCTFEMPLGSARRVVERLVATSALRPDSLFGVIVVTDEDDCSVDDPSLLDPSDDSMGPVTSFRCFAQGVSCGEGPSDPSFPGLRGSCGSSGSYLEVPEALSSLLGSLRSTSKQQVMLAVIAGPPSPVEVLLDGGTRPILAPSCRSPLGSAAPGIRLAEAVTGMGRDGLLLSICDGDFGPALQAIGKRIHEALASRCLARRPKDMSPELPGLQEDCVIVADGKRVPACSSGEPTSACYRLREDAACASGVLLELSATEVNLACTGGGP
ncbi:MAG: hypothetical protein HY698_03720 [Deltaproteobacteria bacterium]|nr:hypothetical protein [Deltaproteobacteria bacterium]